MKKGFAVLATVVLALTAVDSKAASANSPSEATVIVPIAISNTAKLDFGKFAALTGGTVVIATDGARSKTDGVVLATGTPGAAASFNVTGDANATYAITLPSTDQALTHSGGVATMQANSFVSSPDAAGTLSNEGAETVTVGATLNVDADQLVGVYTGSFAASVEYN